MCLAAAAVAMPVISYRAAEQREGAEWTATSTAFRQAFQQNLLQQTEPNARVELTSLRTNGDGLRARGTATLFDSADSRALLVSAVLRGPSAPQPATPAQPAINVREHNCLAEAIYYEARGETQQGQVAVAEVVMNRVHSPFYPKSICAVVYQGSDRDTGCQFTFTCDGSLAAHPRGRAWIQAQHLATAVMSGYTRPITQHATHYHTNAIDPRWSSMLIETTTIGSHVFYRMPNAAERAELMDAAQRRHWVAPGARPETAPLIPQADQAATDAAATADGGDDDATAPAPTAPQPAPATPAHTERSAQAQPASGSPA
ncbi:MAG: cell wall hydrolase [Proteobacteria bacterium]|nr:cell wall hydrolase [Pseudomonadota bacterium]